MEMCAIRGILQKVEEDPTVMERVRRPGAVAAGGAREIVRRGARIGETFR